MFRIIKQNIELFFSKICYSFFKRDKNLWVFGEWYGRRYGDNCFYFVEYLSKNNPEIKICWVTNSSKNISDLPQNVEILIKDSQNCIKCLKKAGAVFVVQGSVDLTDKNIMYWSGALYVNFWHGMPWKKIGSDMLTSKFQRIYNKYWVSFFEAQLFLSPSSKLDEIVKRSYNKKDKDIIKAGYPRNSFFYSKTRLQNKREFFLNFLKNKYNIDYQCIIITYMPTFRDNTNEVFSFESLIGTKELDSLLAKKNAVIVEKGHFASINKRKDLVANTFKRYVRLDEYPTQDLLAASDLLITDYSSCFFDFLLLDRPIIHYLYDYDYYANEDRGLYYKTEQVVCGDVAYNIQQLMHSLLLNIDNPQKDCELRKLRKLQFMNYENKDSCKQVFSFVKERMGL